MTHDFIDLVNVAGDRWLDWMITTTLDSAALLAFVGMVWLVIRRRVAPQVGYCLFLLVPLKLLVPIDVSVPPRIASWTPSAIASRWLDSRHDLKRGAERPVVASGAAAASFDVARQVDASVNLASREPTKEANIGAPMAKTPAAVTTRTASGTAEQTVRSSAVSGLSNYSLPRVTVSAAAMLVWLVIIVAAFCRLVYTQLQFWARLRCATPIDGGRLKFNLPELRRRAGIHRAVRIVECDDIAAPAVSGIIRPSIILPRGIASSLTARQLRWVLLHELAHVRRHDLVVVILQRCVAILHFFNPIVWIANRVAYRLREYACDDFALATSKSTAVDSGQAFLEVLRYAGDSRRMQGALGVFGFDSRAECKDRVERLLDGDRMIRTRAGLLSMCLVVVAAILTLPHVHAATGTATKNESDLVAALVDKSPAKLTGVVKSADGKPIRDALVTIYSAGVRVGYSPFCPTCYADCGKRVVTAADGTFAIEELDPTLVFRVLVVAKGYEPKFATKVDPVKGKQVEIALKSRPAAPEDRSRVVAGQVFSPDNRPMAGALIEPFGCKVGERRWWGSMPNVDPLAVSDDNGRFEIVAKEPVEAVDLQVSARGVATKKFSLVPSGKTENRLQLSAGATMHGHLLDKGQPLAGVLVGLVQADRSTEGFIGATQIGTDADGQFLFTNVPADREYFVYGIMNSLGKRGSVAARRLKVAATVPKRTRAI